MSNTIIKVENLSKRFIIGHEPRERYISLRDVVAGSVKRIFGSGTRRSKAKEEFWALKDLNFEIEKGNRVGIIGRNGAGKSTLLKILSRISEPTHGRIHINGRVASLLEVGTGFHPELTGRENIFLNGAILGMSRAEIRIKFDEIVSFAEVEKFLDTPVKRYSSGMYVRLAFAVAAHLEPEILIVDEVLAVGDAQFQKKCLGKMEDVSKNEGRTILFVSHNMGVVAQLCKTAFLLKSGELVYSGNVQQTLENYLLVNRNEFTYHATDKSSLKDQFVESLRVINSRNETTSDFNFNESITIKFTCLLKELNQSLLLGISMQDKFNAKVFTVLKYCNEFHIVNHRLTGSLTLPSGLFAPNFYSFTVALWTKDGNVFDIVENVCNINIIDDGTEMLNMKE